MEIEDLAFPLQEFMLSKVQEKIWGECQVSDVVVGSCGTSLCAQLVKENFVDEKAWTGP